jgi:hypothetical protein
MVMARRMAFVVLAFAASAVNVGLVSCRAFAPADVVAEDDANIQIGPPPASNDAGNDRRADVVLPSFDATPPDALLAYDEHPYMPSYGCAGRRYFTFDLEAGVGTRWVCHNDAGSHEPFTFSQADGDRLKQGFAAMTLVPRSSFNDAGCGWDGMGHWLFVTNEDQSKTTIAGEYVCSPGPPIDYVATEGFFGADGMRLRIYSVADAAAF